MLARQDGNAEFGDAHCCDFSGDIEVGSFVGCLAQERCLEYEGRRGENGVAG